MPAPLKADLPDGPFAKLRPVAPPLRPTQPGAHRHDPALAHRPIRIPQPNPALIPNSVPNTSTLALPLSSGRTISTSVTGPVTLSSSSNPLTITSTGKVTSTGNNVDGVDGRSGTSWTINNAGTVTSAGGYGIALGGLGAITNTGSISGKDGIGLRAGGSITNAAKSSINGAAGSGIFTSGVPATVKNDGSITGTTLGVELAAGGSVTNGAGASISGGGDSGMFAVGGAGTLTNAGVITAPGTNGCGVYFENGGTITNQTGGSLKGGRFGAFIEGGFGTLVNAGIIATAGYSGFVFGLGGTITNSAGGSISGGTNGVYGKYRAAVSITNSGSINGAGPSGAGIDFAGGGSVANNAGGSITGGGFGVFITGASGTVTNNSNISGTSQSGVDLGAGGSVTNAASATISGKVSGVFSSGNRATVANSGSINATGGAGVYGAGTDLEAGGTVTNTSGASISGNKFGVFVTGGTGSVTNTGAITGPYGIALEAGGSVVNNSGGSISGSTSAVFFSGGAGTITNAGVISAAASGGTGADIEGGGSVINNSGGTLSGANFGVFVSGGTGTVANSGSIAGTNNIGIDLANGGSVTNAAGGVVSSAGFAVAIYGSSGTVTNAGTITGGINSVRFGNSGANRLIVNPGAVFNGAAVGGSGSNTLELAGSSAGSIGGVNTGAFTNFGSLVVDSGAIWTLTGTDTAPTVLNNGSLHVGGSLTIGTAIDPSSTGLFLLDGSAHMEVAAALGTNTKISFATGSDLLIDNTSQFGINVGSSTYAGSLLENFSSGSQIDLTHFASSNVTFNYSNTSGLLQLTNSANQAASLDFQTTTLGSSAFHFASDGASGTLLTVG